MSESSVTNDSALNVWGKIDVELTGNTLHDKLEIGGKRLPYHEVNIHTDGVETTVDLSLLKLPTGEPFTVSGYLISREDWDLLQQVKARGM